jgi:Major Facilitator Superfamily
MFYFMSLFIQGILQYSPVKAGVAFLPFTAGVVVGAGIASQMAHRIAPRVIASAGLVLTIIGMFLNAQLEPTSAYWPDLLVPILFISTGMGLVFVPLTLTALTKVRMQESGIASAVLNTMQQVGGSLGLAVLATIAATTTNNMLDGAADLYAAIGAGLVPPPVEPGALAAIIAAVTEGYTAAFTVAGFMLIAALVITAVLVTAPPQTAHEEQPAAHLG